MPEGPPAGASPSSPGTGIRPRTGLAWAVVILGVLTVIGLGFVAGGDEATVEGQAMDTMQVQVRLQFGMRELLSGLPGAPGGSGPVNPYDTLEKLFGRGTPAQRLRFAVVAGDLVGPGKALEKLDELDRLLAERDRKLTAKQREVEEALRNLHSGGGVAADPEAPARLSPGEAALLRSELGWYGELALHPQGSPGREAFLEPTRRLALKFALLILFLLLGGVLGFAGLLVFWYLVYRSPGTFFRLGPGRAPHGIYVETFAVWFSLFLALSAAGSLLLRSGLIPKSAYLPLEGAVALFGLGALAWPVLRGIPWDTVRDDLGLRLSATPVRDALAGIGCWFMGLPVMAAGFLCTITISAVVEAARGEPDPLAPLEQPNHPIVQEVAGGSGLLLVAFLAVCVAPVAEEIFFRGALYRHLRDATGSRGRAPSVAFSAVVQALVFAAIHPQGLVFIPVLASVSWVLVHAREWRGSLLAPMTAHALHNALVTLLLVLLMGRG